VVDCLEDQTISPELRKQWIEELVPDVRVVALTTFMPQNPDETPEFWNIWRDALYTAAGGKPDVLVAAMDYGWDLAKALGCEFVQCDISRESVPISATQIRENPMKYWKYLTAPARGHFMKKVCFMGPESTGKSTCAKRLADHLDTVYVPEYAKAVIASQNGQFFEENLEPVAVAQVRSERALAPMVNRVMVCDTDPLTTLVWAEMLYGRVSPELMALARKATADLTFLFDSSTPWVADIHRQVLPNAAHDSVRTEFFYRCQYWLRQFGRTFEVVGGNYDHRFEYCKTRCESLL
jgi:HTH-type transcriptional regulator, transcriptional repressor of NAD biosynthesis genes